ncbi:MAG TPA: lipopolysaccharide kinase InaA family protein [Gemmatimonadaceae bacterium]|nr:lipopolysaccharide kinase InaA family protein [Gemmatimonadaceae bacterium]
MSRAQVPAGFVRVDLPHARVLVRADLASTLASVLAPPGLTLHAWAGAQAGARALQGRGIAWAVPLPGTNLRAVVRRNRHGGLFASLTGDRFLAPTRAPYELSTAHRLARRGVETPEVLAIAVYPAGLGVLARSDVATREIPGARDLGALLLETAPGDGERAAALAATATLLEHLADAGARHHDLNVKNVLLAGDRAAPRAVLLDVDRVTFHRPGSRGVREANAARLRRSLAKWMRTQGAVLTSGELQALVGEGS